MQIGSHTKCYALPDCIRSIEVITMHPESQDRGAFVTNNLLFLRHDFAKDLPPSDARQRLQDSTCVSPNRITANRSSSRQAKIV
jgi:hypothetical protein